MTLHELILLRPGEFVRTIKTRTLRLVLSEAMPTRYGGWTGISLMKIGHSWTDPNPIASYDAWAAQQLFEVTERHGCSEQLAREWDSYWRLLHHARLKGDPLPEQPKWPHSLGPQPALRSRRSRA